MLPYALKGKPSDVLLVMLTGRDLGIPPTFALNLIYVVDGHPTLSAKLQLALLRRSGHKVEEVECSPDRVTLRGTHAITGDVVTATYTYAEAEKATYTSWEGEGSGRRKVTKKLTEKDNWQYREDMLYARCSSRLSRRLDPMATGGMYAPEDFGGSEPGPGTVTVEVEASGPVTVEAAAPAEPEPAAPEVVDALPVEDKEKTEYLRNETRRLLRDTPVASKPTKAEMEEAKAEGGPQAVYDLVRAAWEKFNAEEEAALKGEPEPGELPLKPKDAPLPILVSCPSCDAKVDTHELQTHLREHHGGDLGVVE